MADLPRKIRVEQHYNEHPPPHFHAIQGDDEALICISDLSIYAGGLLPPAMRCVRAWAHVHRADLMSNWTAALVNGRMQRIPNP